MHHLRELNSGSIASTSGGILVVLAVLGLAAWAYLPGTAGPELLDDHNNVRFIGELTERPERAMDLMLGNRSGPLGRPVSMASFVIEGLYSGGSIAVSKQVNIALHLLNGLLVSWLLYLLLGQIGVARPLVLAFLLGGLWLMSPLFVSTVLYVVQRMAMLATFFMLCGMISYVYWRKSLLRDHPQHFYLALVGLFFILGLLAKENAVVLVPILLLMEVLWFEWRGKDGRQITWLKNGSLFLIAAGSLLLVIVLVGQWDWLSGRFRYRPFSLEERLLTESRILWDYVRQLFWPDIERMGIYHDDVKLSRSLLEPATTFYAIMAWLAVVAGCVLLLRWRWGRYIVFGLSWFLIGHSVESTVLSLELYFEHRNYFPAIGLFLAVGVLVSLAIKGLPEIRRPSLAYLSVGLLLLSLMTSSQVQIWSSRPLLIMHHLNGHPDSFRANTDMAVQMAQLGDLAAARKYSERAFAVDDEERDADFRVRNLALMCISGKPVTAEVLDEEGVIRGDRPLSSVYTLITLVRLLQDNVCPEFDREYFADRMADVFLVEAFRSKGSPNVFSSLAVLENALQRYDNALAYTERFLAFDGDNTRGLLMKLHFTTALGKVDEARAVISQLQGMESAGRLTVGEKQTLALYLENS